MTFCDPFCDVLSNHLVSIDVAGSCPLVNAKSSVARLTNTRPLKGSEAAVPARENSGQRISLAKGGWESVVLRACHVTDVMFNHAQASPQASIVVRFPMSDGA